MRALRTAGLHATVLSVLLACGDGPTPPQAPLSIQKAPINSGDNQTDTVLATLAPFRVLVQRGTSPVQGVTVRWTSPSDSTVPSRNNITDVAGIASLTLTYDGVARTYTMLASVDDATGSPVTFHATANPGKPTSLRLVSGNNQAGATNARLSADYTVQVTDSHDNGVAGVVIDWAVTAGAGSMLPTETTTQPPSGYASATHTLGPDDGPQTITATASGLPATPQVTFTARSFSLGSLELAFASDRDDANGEIYAMHPEGAGVVRLTNNAAPDLRPTWSPDGVKIAFTSGDIGSSSEVSVMNADGSGITSLSSGHSPAWSPDGTKIVFVRDDLSGTGEIYVMNADGSSLIQLTSNGQDNGQPTWSPDGTRIAFVSDSSAWFGRQIGIYVMNADGTGQINLSGWQSVADEPAWSPDGTKIAFSATFGAGEWSLGSDVLVMDVDGSEATTRLNSGYGGHAPAWSPDGTKIAFIDSSRLLVADPDGSSLNTLTDGVGSSSRPAWSPDGTKIAVSRFSDIYLIAVDGSGQMNLTRTPALYGSLAWRP